MAAAIWSAEPAQIWRFPAKFLVRFCQNHGLLSIFDRPQWMSVAGGKRAYRAVWLTRRGPTAVTMDA
jgi:hypothetical protein